MKPSATLEPLNCFSDPRGLVVEPLGPAELSLQRNVHLVITAPGGVRGNHLHEKGTEVFVVLGPALVRLRDHAGVKDFEVADGKPVRFTIPAGVAHAIQNTGSRPMILISFNTDARNPQAPDVVSDVLIPV